MTSTEHDNDASPADLTAGCCGIDPSGPDERVTVTCAVVGLTNFGERPLEITRPAEVLDRRLG